MKKRKHILSIFLTIPLILGTLGVDLRGFYPAEYPAIMVVPAITLNETLAQGENLTVSIYTDYNESDITGFQFKLYYNASILNIGVNKTDTWIGGGMAQLTYNTTVKPVVENSEMVYVNEILKTRDVDYLISYDSGSIWFFPFAAPPISSQVKATYQYGVVNGDLITESKSPNARFKAGTFNNTSGELLLTKGYFFYQAEPVNITSGPGILANVSFTVVGYGISNITLGDDTQLWGYTDGGMGEKYIIIDAQYEPDHIQHGYFSNKILGDLDGDGDVDWVDFGDFASAYGSKGPPQKDPADGNYNLQADLDLDGDVDWVDFGDFATNYGRSI